MIDDPIDHAPEAVPTRQVLASIFGVWTCYYVLITARSFIVDAHPVGEMLWRRGVVTLAGALITVVMWAVLRRLSARPLAIRVAATLLVAAPAALGAAWVNYKMFVSMEPNWMLDDGRTRLHMDKAGNFIIDTPGSPQIKVRDPDANSPSSIWKELSDVTLGRYFLLIAWGALFMAMSNAADVRAAERRAAAFRRAAKAAELRSLRYQVNPHFLFNTLNSLSALVMTGRRADAEAMIQTLSHFYRTSLADDPTADVQLSEEVRLQQLYLDIEAVRFPKRLRVAIDIPDALANACVPGLILQPLVENAVKHGVAATARAVTIAIRAQQVGDALRLTVADDAPPASRSTQGSGIGLSNVRDRVAARHGSDGHVAVERSTDGFSVTITLPLLRNGC